MLINIERYRTSQISAAPTPEQLIARGNAQLKRGHDYLQLARGYYEWTIEVAPECFEAHYNLGLLFRRLDEPEKAIAHFEQALAIDPVFPSIHFILGDMHRMMGSLEHAIRHYLLYREHQPPPNVYREIALIHIESMKRPGPRLVKLLRRTR